MDLKKRAPPLRTLPDPLGIASIFFTAILRTIIWARLTLREYGREWNSLVVPFPSAEFEGGGMGYHGWWEAMAV